MRRTVTFGDESVVRVECVILNVFVFFEQLSVVKPSAIGGRNAGDSITKAPVEFLSQLDVLDTRSR